MLTPLEIENKKFKKELIGYSVAEVEEFVQLVTESYETIYKENLANRDKINMLSSAIKQYKTMEETLQNAILVAQSAGEEVTRNAKARAENIINEAQNSAAQILADAGKEVTKVSYEYEEMKRNVEVFRTRIISLLTSQLDIVKEFSMPESGKRAEEKAVETAPGAEDTENDTSDKSVAETIKKLERMTRELPKIVMNENGEYVAAEDVEKPKTSDVDRNGGISLSADSEIDEDLGF